MTTQDPMAVSQMHEKIERRAADFFQRRRFWRWSEADQAEFSAWLAESDFHRVAYLRLEGGLARVATLAALRFPEPEARAGRRHYRWFAFGLLAAASVVLAVVLGMPFMRHLMEPPQRAFATNVGGRAHLKFADGTVVELNTSTVVRYRMTTDRRTVWLDSGEAYFRVAHNAADPFTVVAGGHRITDLGTEFAVRDGASGIDVTLVKGRAQLASENPGTPVATLVPGDEAVATPKVTTITRRTGQQLSDQLAWRRGVLVFRNARLADAVREFNRYNETKLVIEDPAVADLKFSAEIKTDHFEDFLELAQAVLNLRVDREGNDILISRGAREGMKRAGRTHSRVASP